MVRKVDLLTLEQSRSFAVVVVQHPAQALVPLNVTMSTEVMRLRADDLVREALVITFGVVVRDEIVNGCPERLFSEEDHRFQAGFFDVAHEALSVRVQIR
jgi:hypothetical protein